MFTSSYTSPYVICVLRPAITAGLGSAAENRKGRTIIMCCSGAAEPPTRHSFLSKRRGGEHSDTGEGRSNGIVIHGTANVCCEA